MRRKGSGLAILVALTLAACSNPEPPKVVVAAPDVSWVHAEAAETVTGRCPVVHKFSPEALVAMSPADLKWLDQVNAFLAKCRARQRRR